MFAWAGVGSGESGIDDYFYNLPVKVRRKERVGDRVPGLPGSRVPDLSGRAFTDRLLSIQLPGVPYGHEGG